MSDEIKAGEDFGECILREQVRLAMQQVPTMQVTSFIVALILCYLVRGIVPRVNILAWVLMMLAIVVGRIVLYCRFHKVREIAFAGKYWKWLYLVLAFVSGVFWGLSAFIIFPAGNPELISLFLLVIANLSAATTISHSSIKWAPAAWETPALLLYACRCIMERGEFGYALGFLIILYLLAIIRHSFIHNRSITSAIALRFENLKLLGEGQKANDTLRQEVRERKLAEEALLQSEERLAKAFHANPAPLAITRFADGYILDVNESFLHRFGCRREEVIGHVSTEFVNYGGPNGRAELLEHLHGQAHFGDYEVSLRTICGDVRQVLISTAVTEIRGEECILTSLVDITERKLTEDALRESEEKHRTLFESMSQGVLYRRADGTIMDVNPAALGMLGLTREEFMAEAPDGPSRKLIREDGSPFPWANRPSIRALQTGSPVNDEVMGVLNVQTGSYTWLVLNAIPLYRQGETAPYRVFVTLHDITERKRAEEEIKSYTAKLEQSNQALQHFAHIASHDLQEPLRTVSSFVQLLEKRYKGKLDADADEFIAFAVDGARRMQSLIQDLLMYSRVDIQGNPFVPTDMEAVFKSTLSSLHTGIEESGAVISHDPLPRIPADPSQMIQLLQNLIGNGLKFRSEKPPRVHISAKPQNGEWLFSVKDNGIGIGIDEKFFERIFKIFQRLHTKEEYPGTGIGLAICKKIVERHGGRIWFESAPGEGAVFYFTMPRQ